MLNKMAKVFPTEDEASQVTPSQYTPMRLMLNILKRFLTKSTMPKDVVVTTLLSFLDNPFRTANIIFYLRNTQDIKRNI